MLKTKKRGICVYCGQSKIVIDEHVPPQCLFKGFKPSELIKIPACSDCNGRKKSMDDEYFATMLSFREDILDHVDAKPMIEAVERALENPNKEKFREAILSGFRIVEVYTPEGIYAGKLKEYKVDLRRIKENMSFTLKGLYYHEKKERIPDDYEILIFTPENIEAMSAQHKEDCDRLINVVSLIKSNQPQTIGKVFSYWVGFDAQIPGISAWLFVFFEKLVFTGISRRKKLNC